MATPKSERHVRAAQARWADLSAAQRRAETTAMRTALPKHAQAVIRDLIDSAPEFSPETRAKLASLLAPASTTERGAA